MKDKIKYPKENKTIKKVFNNVKPKKIETTKYKKQELQIDELSIKALKAETDNEQTLAKLSTYDSAAELSQQNKQDIEKLNNNTNVLAEMVQLVDRNYDKLSVITDELIYTTSQHTIDIETLKNESGSSGDSGEAFLAIEDLRLQHEADTTQLSGQISTNQSNISTLTTRLDNLVVGGEVIDMTAYDNKIAELEAQQDTNTADIQNLKTAGDLADLTLVNTKITALETQQTVNTADIEFLKRRYAYFNTVPDEHYNPKTPTDYQPGTIIQTYDFDERLLALSGRILTTPDIYFCAEAGAEGNFNIEFDYQSDTGGFDFLVEYYVNDTKVSEEIVSALTDTATHTFRGSVYSVALNETEKTNFIYCKIQIQQTGHTMNISRFKVDIISPNADAIAKRSKFAVDYVDGTYYISDCSSGTVKLATIKSENLYNIDNLEFVDLGYKAQQFTIGINTVQYGTTYKYNELSYVYQDYSNKWFFIRVSDSATYTTTSNINNLDWYPKKNKNAHYYGSIYPSGATYLYVPDTYNNLYRGNLSKSSNTVKMYAPKYYGDINDLSTSYNNAAFIDHNGQVYFVTRGTGTTTNPITLCYGTIARCYCTRYEDGFDFDVKIYVKQFDKIIEYYITTNRANGQQIASITEIGSYEDFFLGANNDYFIVKGGKLSYHKFPVEDATTETETETIE